jgi:hypothetical protein
MGGGGVHTRWGRYVRDSQKEPCCLKGNGFLLDEISPKIGGGRERFKELEILIEDSIQFLATGKYCKLA